MKTRTTEEAALAVGGMDCASCVAHVEKALRSVPGVQACQVNLARSRAVVQYDPAQTSPDQLAEVVTGSGYAAAPEDSTASAANAEEKRLAAQQARARAWLRRAMIGAILWLPVEVLHWTLVALGYHHMPWMDWLALASSTIAITYVGAGFYHGAWTALKHGTSNMDTLIAMGSTVAYLYSLVAFVGYLNGWWATLPNLYFMEAAGLLALISLGHWLEARARDRAGSAIHDLLNLAPPTALRLDEDAQTSTSSPRFAEVPVNQVHRGDRLLIRPGDRIPVDGVVIAGQSEVDESMISGEPIPVTKTIDDTLIGGTVNTSGRLILRATAVGAQTALAQIVRLVETAQSSKPPVQRLADKISAIFVPIVLGIATLTGIGWYVWGSLNAWPDGIIWAQVAKTVCSVLIIACPCALGLAVPATLMVGIGRGARRGILIRDIDALQSAEVVQTVVLDKTGTVTQGRPTVARIIALDPADETEVLQLASTAEQYSEHPLARAIVTEAQKRGLPLADIDQFNSEAGLGVVAASNGQKLLAGSANLLSRHGIHDAQQVIEARLDPGDGPMTLVHVAAVTGGEARHLGAVGLSDQLKLDSISAIQQLHALHLRTLLLTGDNQRTAVAIAKQVGIDEVRANVKPDEKAKVIAELQRGSDQPPHNRPQKVAMVGDGINDAPALATADLGIAVGSGSDIAKETGDVVLVSGSLHGIASSIRLSRATMSKIRQNLFLAFFYNVLAIPLAAAGLLNPLIAAAAMALSDVTVLTNALLLRRKRID